MFKNNNLDGVQMALIDKNIIVIGGEIDGDTAIYVREAILRLTGKGSPPIELQITSSGGSVDVSLDIYDYLKGYAGEITGIVYGYAKSMAVIILQACKKRIAMKHATLLIHHISRRSVSLDILRDPKKIEEIREDLEKSQKMLDEILMEKTGKTLEEIRRECSMERDMSTEEAKEFGLIDEIR